MWPLGLRAYLETSVEVRKGVDALLCWPSDNGAGWVLMVRGHTAIRAYKKAGWVEIVNSLDIRYADVSDVRLEDMRRFNEWYGSFGL